MLDFLMPKFLCQYSEKRVRVSDGEIHHWIGMPGSIPLVVDVGFVGSAMVSFPGIEDVVLFWEGKGMDGNGSRTIWTPIETGWWLNQPIRKMLIKWESSPNRGENKKYLKPQSRKDLQ